MIGWEYTQRSYWLETTSERGSVAIVRSLIIIAGKKKPAEAGFHLLYIASDQNATW